MLKKLAKTQLFTFFLLFFFPFLTKAADNYVTLSGFNLGDGNPSAGTLPGFINTLYTVGVSIASVLAIVFIFYAGFTYTTSSSADGKTAAKRRIQAALGGLLLALGSYIILRTINPQLVYINLGFTSIDKKEIEATILSEEARKNLAEQQRVLKQEEDAYNSIRSGTASTNGNTPQPVWTGSSFQAGTTYTDPSGSKSLKGIPVDGASNPTAAKFGVPNEQLTTSIMKDGSLWARGRGSWFGGIHDHCVQPEPYPIGGPISKSSCWGSTRKTGIEKTSLYPNIKLKTIDTTQNYVAARWDYSKMSASQLKGKCLSVYSVATKKTATAGALDWGPNPKSTNKSIDLSPGLFKDLGYPMKSNGTPAAGSGDMFYFRFIDGTCNIHQ